MNLGEPQATADTDADNIIALETAIAKATPPREELRDPSATYHPMPVAQLATIGPARAVAGVLRLVRAAEVRHRRRLGAGVRQGLRRLVASTPLPTWKAYLRYKVADAYATALPKRFADASFAFRSTTLAGVKEQLPRSERCTMAADASLRDVLGRAYVEKAFSPAAKARALALVNNLQSIAARRHRAARLDERADQDEGRREARRVHQEDRLSGQVGRLLVA